MHQFLIQAQSISRFLEPCRVNVIVNEVYFGPWMQWFDQNCKQYFSRHELCILTWQDFFDHPTQQCKHEYDRQQIYKLIFATKTNSDYLILDTKNWFAKTCVLDDFHRQSRPQSVFVNFGNFYIDCCKKYGEYDIRGITTPYPIDIQAAQSLIEHLGVNGLRDLFNEFSIAPWSGTGASEFVLYDVYAQSIGLEQDPGQYVEYNAIFELESNVKLGKLMIQQWLKQLEVPTVKMLTMRQQLFNMLTPELVTDLTKFLEN
jgi:hypothetical protein